ncbi:Transposon Tf2-6 polyprotein [Labeo rohita]|uniref:Transposon Tf2-6 polyprotein n=1 Tax=Labeo rohita TaxID=84645 RepID=A0ABQ8N1G6_LABRO|nr:Transposon Tf2-6 polyprotein [Labeo rohita]
MGRIFRSTGAIFVANGIDDEVATEAASKNVLDLQQTCNSIRFKVKKPDHGKKGETGEQIDTRDCYRCGGKNHKATECRFKKDKCYECGKIGHIARACRNKNKQRGHMVTGKRGEGVRLHRAFNVLSRHEEVFKEELGTLKGTTATLYVPNDASPRFYRPRSVPYALKTKVEEEINRLLRDKIISPVKYSEWAAPVVPILKPDGSIRLFGDYKLTVNRVSTLEQYPIPRVEDLFALLDGGKQFTKLDMSHAYQQIIMDENSKKYLTRGKCVFLADEVEYLGHQVDAQGLHPTGTKVKAIEEAPEPRNVTELKAYLGLLNYYKFLPNLAMLLAPLHLLLRKDVQWLWKKPQKEVFKESKALLNSARVLVHYSSDSELILACDASPYGVGAVLSKRRKGESTEKPLGFMSRTLTAAEKRYSQLDKEGLAVIFGIQRFHKYLYGRAFALCTDHKPLINLFNETKAIPQMGSPRVQRWAVMLQAYQYNIVYKPGKYHQNAYALSSLPIPGEGELDDTNDQMLMMDLMDDSPVSAVQIRRWTSHDITLSKERLAKCRRWMCDLGSKNHHTITRLSGCIETVTSDPFRYVKNEGVGPFIHVVAWYGSGCGESCQRFKKAPAQAPLHPWEWPGSPRERLHVDYTEPFLGRMFLILVDSHSKWMEVYPTMHATSQITIEKLRLCFSTHGLPKMLVSDNGSRFTSEEFGTFMKTNGIQHVLSAPYHPSSNGLAERVVQTFKEGMKKMKGDTVETRTKILKKQQKQKEGHDKSCKLRSFEVGDSVYVRNYSGGPKWIPAVVKSCTGPLSYKTALGQGQTVKRHVDQMRTRSTDEMFETVLPTEKEQDGGTTALSTADVVDARAGKEMSVLEKAQSQEVIVVEKPVIAGERQPTNPRRSAREKRSPARFKDYVA